MILQAKNKNCFRVIFVNFGKSIDNIILTQNVISINRPTISFPEKKIEPILVVVRDDSENKIAKLIQKQSAINSEHMFDVNIETINEDYVTSRFRLYSCNITEIKWGNLTYLENSPVEIGLVIQPNTIKIDFEPTPL